MGEWLIQHKNIKLDPILLTSLTLTPTWISNHIYYQECHDITYQFLNFNGCTVEVWERISNFISHLSVDVITYPCWDQILTMLVKRAIYIYIYMYIWEWVVAKYQRLSFHACKHMTKSKLYTGMYGICSFFSLLLSFGLSEKHLLMLYDNNTAYI